MHTPTIKIGTILFCILSLSTLSCKKFLATYSQNNSFIESTNDLDELLIGDAYFNYASLPIPNMLYSMDDDVEEGIPATTQNYPRETGFQYWQAQPRINTRGEVSGADNYFDHLYGRIARINTILNNVPLLREKGESVQTLNRISGEAHFLRAYYYFMLVNIYGKPYHSSTAAIDFGVPLKTEPAIKDQFSSRNTTKQVYDQIIADLLKAEQELAGSHQSSSIRANQLSAQALLSRVYLFMENYELALHYAEEVIKLDKYKLIDLNGHIAGEDFLTRNSPEVIFTMGGSAMTGIMAVHENSPSSFYYKASDDLTMNYSQQDLRLKVFFITDSKGQMRVAKNRKAVYSIENVSDMFLIRLAEVYLNKAEALAGLDRFEDARTTLQEFRKNRFKPAELPTINATGAALMNFIRDERRLELCLETHRWFDLRRYGVNSRYPFSKTIRHRSIVFTGTGYADNGYYELGPYAQDAAAYIVPIANDEIAFNQGRLMNEPRPERPLKQ